MKILVAVDGSRNSLRAVDFLAAHVDWYREKPRVELATVHLPLPTLHGLSMAVSQGRIRRHFEEEGKPRLAAAKPKLDAAGIACRAKVLVGPVAESLVAHAKQARCDLILIGSRGMTEIGNVLLGSTATKVLHLSTLPVLLVK